MAAQPIIATFIDETREISLPWSSFYMDLTLKILFIIDVYNSHAVAFQYIDWLSSKERNTPEQRVWKSQLSAISTYLSTSLCLGSNR